MIIMKPVQSCKTAGHSHYSSLFTAQQMTIVVAGLTAR